MLVCVTGIVVPARLEHVGMPVSRELIDWIGLMRRDWFFGKQFSGRNRPTPVVLVVPSGRARSFSQP